jgi:hypothetical protein
VQENINRNENKEQVFTVVVEEIMADTARNVLSF